MTLLHPSVQVQELYPVGSIIEATCPPNENWIRMEGQLLNRSTYATLLSVLDDDNPQAWQAQEVIKPLDSTFDSAGIIEVAYNGSRWVAVGDSGTFAYSDNGTTWTCGNMIDASKDYLCIAWNGTVFFSVGYNSTSGATSTNGSSWTARTMPASLDWKGVCWDGTYFILVASDSAQVYRSTDGITWNTTGVLSVTGGDAIASDGSGLTVVLAGGTHQVSSNGGTTWTEVRLPYIPIGSIYKWVLSYENGYFMETSHQQAGNTWISEDGFEWRQIWYNYGVNTYFEWQQNPSIGRWRYLKDQWFGIPASDDQGVRTPDMKRFYPWYINIANQANCSEALYNSSTGKIVLPEIWYRHMTVCEEYGFDEATYFQLPRTQFNKWGINNVHKYIRAL